MAFLRTIMPRRRPALTRRTVELVDGAQLSGLVLNESPADLQLRTDDDRIHLLRPVAGKFREATSQSDWTTYNGNTNANRYSLLKQITPQNVARVAPKWIFSLDGATARGETTPVVVQGIMYVTSGNECWALDAGAGREIWHFQRPLTKGLVGNASQGFNRGVAWDGDRVFMVTDNAHLIALNRFTGNLLWETEMADWRQNYNATSAPLFVDTSSSRGLPAANRALAASSLPTIRKTVKRYGVSGPCRVPVNAVRRPGEGSPSSIPAE
jgi:alcohol dehydrogenase (cytochrome c)